MSAQHLTTKQASARAGVSRFALQRAQKNGDLFAVKDNKGRWMWDIDALDAWLEQKPTQTNVPNPTTPKDTDRIQDLALALGRAEGKAEALQTALEKAEADTARERDTVNQLLSRSLLRRIFNKP